MERALFVVPNNYDKVGGIKLPVVQYSNALKNEYSCDIKTLSYHPAKQELTEVLSILNNYSTILVYGLNQAYAVSKLFNKNKTLKKTIALLVDSENFYATSILNALKIWKSIKQYIYMLGKKILYGKKESSCLRKYTDVLYVSNVDKEYVTKTYGRIKSRLHVIENGIVSPQDIKGRKHDSNTFRIGFLSSFGPGVINENLRPLVEEIMPSVVDAFPSATLVVAGRGEEEFLQNYLAAFQFVEYLGAVDSLESFYNDVDIVVPLTLKRNGILNKILEAWSYGKCVIGYDYNFYAFQDAIEGTHFLAGKDCESIVKKIIDTIELKVDIDCIGKNARNLVLNRYDWESRRHKFLTIVQGNIS